MQYVRWVTTVLIPWGGVNLSPREERAAGMPATVPEFEVLLQGPSVCGSGAEVADRIAAMRSELGLDLHIAMFDHGGIPDAELADALERFASDVIPVVTR
jgi:hypothetical protein